VDAEDRIPVSASDILTAAAIGSNFVNQGSMSIKEYRKAVRAEALDWIDWAVEESDRGQELRQLKAEALYHRKGNGNITISKPE
jgi:hypothetical protein